jgi:hypothetical protein
MGVVIPYLLAETTTKGLGKAVYFKDPSGHVLEIKTY